MNTVIVRITSANDFTLVKNFIERHFGNLFSGTNVKSFFFDGDTFKRESNCDSIGLFTSGVFPCNSEDSDYNMPSCKVIDASTELLENNLEWLKDTSMYPTADKVVEMLQRVLVGDRTEKTSIMCSLTDVIKHNNTPDVADAKESLFNTIMLKGGNLRKDFMNYLPVLTELCVGEWVEIPADVTA